MSLFKNGVGRPTNEIKMKRKIFYGVMVAFVIAFIASSVYLLNGNISNLKGVVSTNDKDVVIKIKNTKNLREVEKNFNNKYVFSSVNEDFELTLENKKSYTLHYEIYINDTEAKNKYKSGSIASNKNIKNIINTSVFKDSIAKGKNNYIKIKWYKNSISEKNYLNSVGIEFCYSKPLIYVYDYVDYNGFFDIKYSSSEVNQNTYVDKNTNIEQSLNIYNPSDENYYYRTFTYDDSKVNNLKLSKVSSCDVLNSKSEQLVKKEYSFDEKQKSKTLQVKFYSSKNDCSKDKKGIKNTNVIYKYTEGFINLINKFYVKKLDNKGEYNIRKPLKANNWVVQVYYKKTLSTDKWKKIIDQDCYNAYSFDIKLEKQKTKNETYRVLVKWTKDNSDETYTDISIDKWKADGWKKIKKDNTTWMYKDYLIKW